MKINMKLLPMKGHYFLFNAGTAPVVPFIPTLAKQLGFSSVVVGSIYAFLPVMGMFAKPAFGALADRLHCQKAMFICFLVITMISFFGIPWIPPLPATSKAEVHCAHYNSDIQICSEKLQDKCFTERIADKYKANESVQCTMDCAVNQTFRQSVCDDWKLPYCNSNVTTPKSEKKPIKFFSKIYPNQIMQNDQCVLIQMHQVSSDGKSWHGPFCNSSFLKANCSLECASTLITDISTNPKIPDSEVASLYQFWLFFVLLVLSWIGMAVVVSVGDAICFELLGDTPGNYGNQRMWGSIGWGLFSLMTGFIVDKASEGTPYKNYLPAFYIMLCFLFFDVVLSSRLQYKHTKRSPSILRDVGKLLTDVQICIFLLWCVGVGMCTAMVWNFLFWYLEDLASSHGCGTISWIKTLEGLIMGIQCFGGELPFFFLSGKILKKIGHVNAMSLVLFTFGVRFTLYSFLKNPWWCLPIELLNGLTFGIFYSTMTSYASIVAPSGTEATVQGLVGAVFEGIGVSLGSFIGGVLFKNFSGATAFQVYGVGAWILCVLHIIAQYFMRNRRLMKGLDDVDFKRTQYASPPDALNMIDDSNHLT